MGAYLGLFNGTICLPQIVAAALGGVIYKYVTNESSIYMLLVAGILLVLELLVSLQSKKNKLFVLIINKRFLNPSIFGGFFLFKFIYFL